MASRPYFDGRGFWLCRYKPDPAGGWQTARLCRDPRWKKGQPRPAKWPREAEERQREFADIEYRARHGLGVAPPRPKGLETYVADYLAVYRKSHRPGSVRQMERHARDFLAFAQSRGVASLQSVTKALCRDYLESRFVGGVGHNALQTEWGYLSGIWGRAAEDGLVQVNPWRGVTPPGEPADAGWTHWPNEEIERIAAAAIKPYMTDAILLMGHTGFRLSTALAMRFDWIEWGQGIANIPAGPEIKTAYPHVLGERARSILERRQIVARSDLVFPNPYRGGGVIPADTVRRAIDKAIRAAGVKVGTPHDLRHSYARNLVLAGVPITVVQKQLGHSSLAMTMRYSTADEDSIRAAIARAEVSRPTPPSADSA